MKSNVKNEVVNAYIRGELDRRGFIRKLTAVGVSSGAAIAYATSLVPNAAAGPARSGSGFISRQQDADEEYGDAVVIDDVATAVATIFATAEGADALVESLLAEFVAADFTEAGLEDDALELLTEIGAQLEEHMDALNGFPGTGAGATGGATPPTGDLMEQLTALADLLDDYAGMFVALIPSIENVEDRQLFAQMAIVAGRMAAIVNHMVGQDPLPAAFEAPVDPAE